jgi:hypothetical protein
MARFRHDAFGSGIIGAAVGYAAARSVDPGYDQAAMLLGIAAACYVAFVPQVWPQVWSFLRDRLAPHGRRGPSGPVTSLPIEAEGAERGAAAR